MTEFRQPTTEDAQRLKNILISSQPKSCDYSAGNLLCWNFCYKENIAFVDGCLVLRLDVQDLFGFPKGENYISALKKITDEFPDCGFYGLEKQECDIINELFPGKYSFEESRASFDYVYRRSDLAELKGKKYHSKRNHISYFVKNNNWSYEELTTDKFGECLEMNKKWIAENIEKDPIGIEKEKTVLDYFFKNFDLLELKGGILRSDGKIIAFTFGERLNDNTFVTHYEKAFSSIRGAYPMINMLFARESLGEYEYINREDDVGSEGLRKAKLSYCPVYLTEKYTAVRL